MEKCKVCSKSIKGAVKSAKRKDGSYYIICPSCNNVMLVTVNDEITTICRTSEGNSKVTIDQMKEAYKLFSDAGIHVSEYIDTINTDRKSAQDLKEVIAPKEAVTSKESSNESLLHAALKTNGIKYIVASDLGIGYATSKEDLDACLKAAGTVLKVYELKEVSIKSETKTVYTLA